MPVPPPYDSDEYEGWTETQLVRQVTGNAGAAGAGAGAELTRRLMVQLRQTAEQAEKRERTLTKLTAWLVALTVVLLVLTAVLVVKEVAG